MFAEYLQHDPEQCTPGGEDGNFIMFARATSGDKKNNNHFSPCSLKSINPVLNFKARSAKGCFTGKLISYTKNSAVRCLDFFEIPSKMIPFSRTSSILVWEWRRGGWRRMWLWVGRRLSRQVLFPAKEASTTWWAPLPSHSWKCLQSFSGVFKSIFIIHF